MNYGTDITRKYYVTNNYVDSLYENNELLMKVLNGKKSTDISGRVRIVNKIKESNDTITYVITSFKDGIKTNDSIIERHWSNGKELLYIQNDESRVDTTRNVIIIKNDTIKDFRIYDEGPEIEIYHVLKNGKCSTFNGEKTLKYEYQFDYYKSGFTILLNEVGNSKQALQFYKFYGTTSVIFLPMKDGIVKNDYLRFDLSGRLIK
jgi:hypothetical protein